MNELTKSEQETIITFNAEETKAEIYTAEPDMIIKLDKYVEIYPNLYKVVKQDKYSKTYEVLSKELILFGILVEK